jgi:hypothetical protein
MFDRLGEALSLTFEERTFGDDRNIDGWIALGADRDFVSRISKTDRPCYVVFDEGQLVPCGQSPMITFSQNPKLAAVLRGRQMTTAEAVPLKALPPWLASDCQHLASKDGAPIWSTHKGSRTNHHYVATPLPELKEGEPLFAHFNGDRFLALLPLVLFLRSLTEDKRWEPPPLCASFMFDDPNLHWRTYGYMDFSEILKHANRFDYHVALATIPLDAGFVHSPTARLFKENGKRLSLLYHGNNHVSDELARPYPPHVLEDILRQAVARIVAMERRTGLKVARVMAPPHGACSEASLSRMARVGFEAACVSRGSLHFHNKHAEWPLIIGMQPCDIIAGLPVFPRFALSEKCHNAVLLAALLRQPIIPRAHHQDVADGYQLLDRVANFINSLGGVTWSNLTTISRSLYARLREDETLSVRMFSKRITVPIPLHTCKVRIVCPPVNQAPHDRVLWRTAGRNPIWQEHSSQDFLTVEPGTELEVVYDPPEQPTMELRAKRISRALPLARRLLTETRDRTLPSIHRIRRRLGVK